MRRRVGRLLMVGVIAALSMATVAARPPVNDAQRETVVIQDSSSQVDSVAVVSVVRESPVVVVRTDSAVMHVVIDSVALHAFIPVTFNARPRRQRVLRLTDVSHDSLARARRDSGAG